MPIDANSIKVWDILVRLFHWSLVLGFIIAYLTEDDYLTPHVYAGYFIIVLLAIRLIWGLIGTQYARFSDFIYSPSTIKQFIKDTLQFKAKRYIGHNPAGGAMVILMMLSLIVTTITGMAVYAAEDQSGPLVDLLGQVSHFWEEAFEEVHELFSNFTLLLILIHVSGVVFESLMHRENLVKSMITGVKSRDKNGNN